MKVINLTPHIVRICDKKGCCIKVYETSGKIARVNNGYKELVHIDGVPLVTRTDLSIENLPEPQEGVVYIVSDIVMRYCPDRFDLVAPVKQIKVNGRVVGCRAFVSNR